jgi:hypothetical protein
MPKPNENESLSGLAPLEKEFAIIAAEAKERELKRIQIEILTIRLQLARGMFVGVRSRMRLNKLLEQYPEFDDDFATKAWLQKHGKC